MAKMHSNDPAYWMLSNGIETTPVVYKWDCYICRDDEFARMGLPLCRKCPACGGHIAADDTRCDDCELNEQLFWDLVVHGVSALNDSACLFEDSNYEPITDIDESLLKQAVDAYERERVIFLNK